MEGSTFLGQRYFGRAEDLRFGVSQLPLVRSVSNQGETAPLPLVGDGFGFDTVGERILVSRVPDPECALDPESAR